MANPVSQPSAASTHGSPSALLLHYWLPSSLSQGWYRSMPEKATNTCKLCKLKFESRITIQGDLLVPDQAERENFDHRNKQQTHPKLTAGSVAVTTNRKMTSNRRTINASSRTILVPARCNQQHKRCDGDSCTVKVSNRRKRVRHASLPTRRHGSRCFVAHLMNSSCHY